MKNVILNQEEMPVFSTLKVNGKGRRVRLFGECALIKANGEKQIIRKREYLFIKDEPNTRFTSSINE